jgi:predicted dehydrogenase
MLRRAFIKTAAAGSIGTAIGTAIAATPALGVVGANEKIVLALVGCGDRGTGCIINCCKLNKNVVIKTVCDVRTTKLAQAAQAVERTFGYRPQTTAEMNDVFADKDIDAVWVATADHWHAVAAIRACQAGKDVYLEKNPTHFIHEGRKLINAAAQHNRIVQIGCQNRSAPYNFAARDYVQSGKLGKIVSVKSYFMLGGGKVGNAPTAPVPPWLDWNRWLGPAPERPYSPAYVIKSGRGGWQNYWDFSGGKLSDEASHTLDLVRMVLGDPGHPRSVYCWGGKHIFGSQCDTPEYQEVLYDFGQYTVSASGGPSLDYMKKAPGEIRMNPKRFPTWRNYSARIEIYGTKGLMYLGRHGGGWQVLGNGDKIVAEHGGVFSDREHQINFIESLRSRKKPNGAVEQGHYSASLVHLGNISYRMGCKQLLFDTEKELFLNDDAANVIARGTYRKGFEI